MAQLIIIRGNSGSGKTTLAQRLQKTLGRNTLVISQDVVRREMLWVRDNDGNPSIELMSQLLRYGRANCQVTILEGILNAQRYEPLFQVALEEYGENIAAFYYDIPFEETLRRHETKSNRFSFGEADMRQWWVEKDYLTLIPETFFSREMTLEDAEKAVLSCIQGKH